MSGDWTTQEKFVISAVGAVLTKTDQQRSMAVRIRLTVLQK